MDYAAHYERLIARARGRILTGYVERHHVLPKCMGGGDEASNLVALTAEEHFVAHQLLAKIHPENVKLLFALRVMSDSKKYPTNKRYGWIRKRLIVKGRHSAETRAKMSAASKGRPKTEEHRAALSKAKMGIKRGPQSEDHRRKISDAQRGKTKNAPGMKTPEYRQRQREAMVAIWAARKREA